MSRMTGSRYIRGKLLLHRPVEDDLDVVVILLHRRPWSWPGARPSSVLDDQYIVLVQQVVIVVDRASRLMVRTCLAVSDQRVALIEQRNAVFDNHYVVVVEDEVVVVELVVFER